jgi:hypothetical protein
LTAALEAAHWDGRLDDAALRQSEGPRCPKQPRDTGIATVQAGSFSLRCRIYDSAPPVNVQISAISRVGFRQENTLNPQDFLALFLYMTDGLRGREPVAAHRMFYCDAMKTRGVFRGSMWPAVDG